MSSAASSREDLSQMWRRQLVLWHLVFAVLWGAAFVIVVVEPPGRYGRGVEVACLLGVTLAYAALAMRNLAQNAVGWGAAYLGVAWGLVLTVQWLDPETETWVLFFILFPQMWAMVGRRLATWGTFVVVEAFALIKWLTSDRSSDMAVSIVVSAVISVGLSLALGLFIHRIIIEAESRAETIDEVRRTRTGWRPQSGVQEERDRLAREIHDPLTQGLTSVLALARGADAALARDDVGTAREWIALIESTAADNLREARLVVTELTPSHLQSRTLAEALGRLVTAVSAETTIDAPVGRRRGAAGSGGRHRGRPAAHRAGGPVHRPPPLRGAARQRRAVLRRPRPGRPGGQRRRAGLGPSEHRAGLAPRRGDGPGRRARRRGHGNQRPRRGHPAPARGAPRTIRLLVVDDHPVVRAGMVAMLSARSDASCSSARRR